MLLRLKLAGKIYLGYILLFLLTAALGGSAVFYLGRVERNAQRLAGRALPAWDFAGQAESLVREAGYFMVAYSLGNDEALYAQAQKPIQDMEALLVRTAGDSAASDTAAGREKIKADLAKYQAGMARSREAVMQAREGGQRIATATAAFFKTLETYLGLQQEAMLGQIEARTQVVLEGQKVDGSSNQELKIRQDRINRAFTLITTTHVLRGEAWQGLYQRDREALAALLPRFSALEKSLQDLYTETRQKANRELLANSLKAFQDFMAAFRMVLAAQEDLARVGRERLAAYRDILATTAGLAKESRDNGDRQANATVEIVGRSIALTALGLLVAAVLSLLLAFLVTRSATRPLRRVIAGLREGAAQVSGASSEVANASQGLAQGASEQAAALEETGSSLEEMSSMAAKSAESAGSADQMAQESKAATAGAIRAMGELRSAMERISAKSDQTARIIKTIDEIAFQTNLLALNAAVEAARAGEAGAGFAVVADEVRSLAMRAAEAARSTAELIEENLRNVKEGGGLVAGVDEAFGRVSGLVERIGGVLGEIAAASSEQAQGVGHINQAMGDIDKVTQQSAANAEQSAAAAQELAAQAETMQGFVLDLAALVGGANDRSAPPPRGISWRREAKALPAPQL